MSMATNGLIVRQSSSYRQGLVLGLTMAEVMILLIFCLLIAIAAFFIKTEQARRPPDVERKGEERTLTSEQRSLADAVSRTPVLVEKLRKIEQSRSQANADEFWRELVETSGEVIAQGITPGTAKKNADMASAVTGALRKANEPPKSPGEIAALVEQGIAAKRSAGHKWPPIISLSEAQGHHFKSGSAELSSDFRRTLVDSVPSRIVELIKEYDVDVIEVVGHTDQQPLGLKQSNLDRDLLSVLKSDGNIASLIPSDNAGLGLARAVSVVSVLNKNPALNGYKIIPLSGAQLVNTDETLTTSDIAANVPERRRIEIRLRKSNQQNIAAKSEAPRSENVPHPPRRPRPVPPAAAPAPLPPVSWPSNPFNTPRSN